MTKVLGYATTNAHTDLKPFEIERLEPTGNEVAIKILYCGVCHSDVHQVKNEWKNTVYPCMPGHEIIGHVTKTGPQVSKYKIGDLVGVGCMVDSCHHCEACNEGMENYCEEGFLGTYNGNMRTPSKDNLTYGGYSESITVREDFVLRIPENLDPASAAPILCAGVTTYSPLKNWMIGPGVRVGVIGLGGLGHTAVKIAKAMGAEVTVITSSKEKAEDARAYGAQNVVFSEDKKSMKENERTLDFILNTIPQPHDINPYMLLLKRDGVLTVVGCIAPLTKPLDLSAMVPDRKTLGTSLIGSIAETQEVLNFFSEHNIAPKVKVIPVDELNDVFAQIDKGDVDYRFVIDISTLAGKKPTEESLVDKVLDMAN